jgi:hypothetical protein
MLKNMKGKLFIIGLISLSMSSAYAVPPPCSQDQLLESSDYAIEGYVINVECGEAYDSKECMPHSESKEFKPELVSNCVATVDVTKSLKGNYHTGDNVKISFVELIEGCKDGSHIIPGSPKKGFKLNSKIRYYNSASCAYSNLKEIEEPTPEPSLEESN